MSDHRQVLSDVAADYDWHYTPGLGYWDYTFSRGRLIVRVALTRKGIVKAAQLEDERLGTLAGVFPRRKLAQVVSWLSSPTSAVRGRSCLRSPGVAR